MNQSDIKKLQDKWFKINEPIGKSLGYPDCCIKSFCDNPPELMQKTNPTFEDIQRYKAGFIHGQFTGFIPCTEHTKQIVAGKITLECLIDYKKRDLSLPKFPNA